MRVTTDDRARSTGMFWIYPIIVMVVFLAVIEWTSRPRKAKGASTDVAVPRPRKEIRDDMNTRIKRSG